MPNLTQVTIANGIPTAGSGTVSTLDNLPNLLLQLAPTTTAAAITPTVTATLVSPVNSAFSTAATGGTLAAGTYFYRVSAINASGETLASTETSQVTTGTTSTVTVNWGAVAGATGYKVYGRTTNAELLIATLGNVLTYTDTGSVTPAGALPANNTTAYAIGFGIGGIMAFANLLAPISFNGILQSITAKFKGTTVGFNGTINVAIFKASPSNGAYADHATPTWNGADMANLVGIYALSNPISSLGNMTIYNLDGIGKAFVGASQSLYAVATVSTTTMPASTSDFTLELAVLPG